MKAYGHSRTDKLECRQGCCTTKSGKCKGGREEVDRAHRKTARQHDNKHARLELLALLAEQARSTRQA